MRFGMLLYLRYCRFSQKAKKLLATYDIRPAPRIIEVDTRGDGHLIKLLLNRFTSRNTFPNVLLRGTSIGGSDDLQDLHENGELPKVLKKEGLSVGTGESN
jgi:glutaredoxin